MKTSMNRSLFTMVMVAVVAILISMTFVGCGGDGPTGPKPDPTPVPTPNPTPNPTPTPQPGVISVTPISASPASGSTLIVGQMVSVRVSVSGVSSGNLSARPSEDGVSPSLLGYDNPAPISGSGIVDLGFTMNSPRKTVAILFYYSPSGGQAVLVPNVIYRVEYTWTTPTLVVSIGPGGVFTPRDSGTVARGTAITYRNDDTVPHQPASINTGMVSCAALFTGEVCTVTTYNNTGSALRVGVGDRHGPNPNAEVHSFTVSP